MKNDNSEGRVLIDKNKPPSSRGQVPKSSKEKFVRSQKTFNKNCHVYYYSKSSNQTKINTKNKEKEISKKLSFNDIEDDEELDHPRPLISDNEEDLEDLKAQFNKEKRNMKNLDIDLKNEKAQDLDLKNIPKSSEIPNVNLVEQINEYSNKKNNKYIPIQNNYKLNTLSRRQINRIKAQVKNKRNYLFNNNVSIYKNNAEKKEKLKGQKSNNINKAKPEIYEFTLSKNITEKKNKQINKESDNNYQIRNDNNNYMNKSSNFINRNQLNKNEIGLFDNQKRQVVYLHMSNTKYQNPKMKTINTEKYQKNFSIEKMIKTDPNLGYNISNNIIENKNQKNYKTINISNINNIVSSEEKKNSHLVRDSEINKLNKNEIPNFKYDKYNTLNLSSSIEIKESELQKRHNLSLNKLEAKKNNSKLRQKTFERGGKFNNVQTTYVVISKKPKTRGIPRANITPEIIDYSKYKLFKPTPSTNYLNYSNLYKGVNNCQHYSSELKFQRMNLNEPKKIGSNKSFSNIPIKKVNISNDLKFDKNNYSLNFIEPSINENKNIFNGQNNKDSFNLINKSINLNQNLIQYFNYNYDYYYNIYQLPNNSYNNFNNTHYNN